MYIMSINYCHTAENMYISSKKLYNDGQYHISCYLAGYVVECAFNSFLKTRHLKNGHTIPFPKGHLNDRNNSVDPAVLLSNKMFKIAAILEPELAKISFIDCKNSDFPEAIVNGKINIDKWESRKRYEQDTWADKTKADEFQKEIDEVNKQLHDLKSKGLMKS